MTHTGQPIPVRRALIQTVGPDGAAELAPDLTDAERKLVGAYLNALDAGPDEWIGSDPNLVAEFRAIMFGNGGQSPAPADWAVSR